MTEFLSHEGMRRLLDQTSRHARAVMVRQLTFEICRGPLTECQIEIAHAALGRIAEDREVVVRCALTQGLRHSEIWPRAILMRLARDVEAVALPLLKDSPMLTDGDLEELLQRMPCVKEQAIAGRLKLSERMAKIVASKCDEVAVAALMNNRLAQVGEDAFHKALDRFPQSETIRDAVMRRDHLPHTVAERLMLATAGTVISFEKAYAQSARKPSAAAEIPARAARP